MDKPYPRDLIGYGQHPYSRRPVEPIDALQRCMLEIIQATSQPQRKTLICKHLERFGFPFVIALKGLSRYHILEALQARINNTTEQEFDNGIAQIAKIARLRLNELIEN